MHIKVQPLHNRTWLEMKYEKKKFKAASRTITTTIFLFACSLPYILPVFIPYLTYTGTRETSENAAHIYLVVVPYVSYSLLEFVDDRQGFNLPLGFLLSGITPSAALLFAEYEPSLIYGHSYGVIAALIATLFVWLVLPERGLTRLT